jgi:predicted heme/steroid binding protein
MFVLICITQILRVTNYPVDEYNNAAKSKKDPFGKKFFHGGEFRMNDSFHIAIMTPVLHYTMGGLEVDPEARVIDVSGKPIPGLFASGEIAGGVHGANRLGGSSLLGCVVFGRVSGDSAAAYMLQSSISAGDKATGRLGAVAGHLLETKVKIDPSQQTVNLEFSWGGSSTSLQPTTSSPSSTQAIPSASQAPQPEVNAEASKKPAKAETATSGTQEYTTEEVAKHNKKGDIWVIVNGEVLDVTNFLPDHPGGEKAIMLYAGRDATEEFNMLHDPKVRYSCPWGELDLISGFQVIPRYAPDAKIGVLKK